MIEDFVRLHTAECFANIGAVLTAAAPPKRRTTAADGTVTSRSRAPTFRWSRSSSSTPTRR
eukprot:4936218-Prymnesium_polylepis.1